MSEIYIYSDLPSTAAELVTIAKETGKSSSVIAFSKEDASELALTGADFVCLVNGNSPMPENYGKAIAAFLKEQGAQLLLVGASARGRDFAARVAGYLDCAMVSDISSMSLTDGTISCERTMFGGAVVQGETLTGLCVITVPAGKYAASQGNSEIVNIDLIADDRVHLVSATPIVKKGTDLKTAEKVVCVGMGMENQADIQMAEKLAEVLGAEIGCSRGIAEERRWLPTEQYIGISGNVIKPKLYLSMGVSGQVQHVFGARDAKFIVAINNNEKAPIFRSADYGIVGDMYEIVPLLTEALKSAAK
jgi:electron transfer flavoprotein alpha subunit